jgi:hypothetical protein
MSSHDREVSLTAKKVWAIASYSDDITYDAVYFRPFNFAALDPGQRDHALWDVSFPERIWDRPRAEQPGLFEQPVEPAPDGDK